MANTFKFGNKQWYGKKGSVLAYNDENNNFKPLPFAFTRASSATRVDENGLIEVVGSNEPRIDYLNNADGHLLLEPSRTNVNTYSEDGSEWDWIQGAISLDSSAIAPDGDSGVYKFTDNTVDGQHRVTIRGQVTDTLEYTFSSFVKLVEGSDVTKIYLLFTTGFNTERYYFDLENGTTLDTGNTGHSIEDYGNGWYRVIATSTATSTTNAIFGVNLTEGGTTYEGTGNGSILVWGAQVEQGSYATSYIPTSGSAVTRAAETCDINVTNFSENIFPANSHTLFVDIDVLADPESTSSVLKTENGLMTSEGGYRLRKSTVAASVIGITTHTLSGFVSINSTGQLYDDNKGRIKIALKKDSDTVSGAMNGSIETLLSTFGSWNNDDFGIRFVPSVVAMKIHKSLIYNTALTDAELIALTS